MKKTDLYTKEGWINTRLPMNDKASIVFMLGGRGIGKTYGILRDIIESKQEFIYMRRQKGQIDECKVPLLNPFRRLNADMGWNIVCDSVTANTAAFYNADSDGKAQGEPLGLAVSLSTFANLRGISSDAPICVYDEFIPEARERPIKDEQGAILNFYETINRNKELLGEKPLKLLLLSNSNNLSSPILEAFGVTQELDNMIRKKQYYKSLYDGDIAIYRYIDSPISERKKETLLYRVSQNEDFTTMAINNNFSAANYEGVAAEDIKQYRPLVSIGNVTVYKHKSQGLYYVVSGIKAAEQYTLLPNSRKAYLQKYLYLYDRMINGRLTFASAPAKIAFERVYRNG